MTWTTELPTQEGWYFVRSTKYAAVFHVSHVSVDEKGRMWIGAMKGSHGQRLKAAADVQYAGPIPEPTEDEA